MNDTFYAIPKQKYDRLVTLHLRKDGVLSERPKPLVKDQNASVRGDGGLRSTAEDYIKFLKLFLNQGTLDETKY